jgi:hypothetical protein
VEIPSGFAPWLRIVYERGEFSTNPKLIVMH